MKNRITVYLVVFFSVFVLAGCIWIFKSSELETEKPIGAVESPVKAHLEDGRTAMFPDGAVFMADEIIGYGRVYSINLQSYENIQNLSTGEIAAYSVYREETNVGASIIMTGVGTVVGVFATAVLWDMIFGSCPTVYTTSDEESTLHGELFSNSIAPILESRDLVKVSTGSIKNDRLRIEIRNEALETHYINHLELLEVSHQPDSEIYSTNYNRVLSLSDFVYPEKAVNITNEDIVEELGSFVADDKFGGYRYSDWSVDPDDPDAGPVWDQVELVFPPVENDNAALHFNLKNSLFSTLMLYDYYLSGQGVDALDWIGKGLSTVSEAVALGDFHKQFMGIQVQQYTDGEYRYVTRIPDIGPVSWRDVAVPVHTSHRDSVKIRLKFLADSWQIQGVRLAQTVEEPEIRIIPAAEVLDGNQQVHPQSENIRSANNEYLVNWPGNRIFIDFETTRADSGNLHSYLLAGQGYYIEWIRSDWLEESLFPEGIDYGSDLITRVQHHWQDAKIELEATFFESKVPVQ